MLERTQAPDANPVNTPLSLRIDARLDCVSQQYVGSCTGNEGFTNVTAGQGWSNEILMPVQFSWTGGNGTLNEFVFGQITLLSYALPSQNGASTLLIPGPPILRCDKGLAHSARNGCVYAQALAVFVLSTSDAMVVEAAQHIKDAQSAPLHAPGKRRIKGAHNSSAGARFGNFLTSERVIDFSQYDGSDVEAFDPLLLRSRSGDDFWIHIE